MVQIIANYVNEQHDTWDQFLREFAYAIRTAVNETTGKTPAELFLDRKLITPFQKLVMVSDGTEFAHEESSGFDRGQRRSNDSRDGKKKGSEVKRELEEKGLSFRSNLGDKHTNKTNKRGPLIRSIPSSWSEKDRMIKRGKRTNHNLTKFRKKSRREETVTPTTSGYNLRPRIGKREEPRPTIERKAQQEGPVRSRKGRERNDSPYIGERTRSSNKNARRGSDQQRHDQERRGTWTKNPCHWRSCVDPSLSDERKATHLFTGEVRGVEMCSHSNAASQQKDILSRSMTSPKRGKFPKTPHIMMYLWVHCLLPVVGTRHPFRWGKRRTQEIPFLVNNNRADIKITVAIPGDRRPKVCYVICPSAPRDHPGLTPLESRSAFHIV
ncbi:uncharacterized protein TNCV_2358401 [Trichonephila clavipes]|nr:uncharacterized protein TNCV_2358401 [Trichonephila clavipes]